MPTAYSYIRFSTPEQLKGDSLRRQLDLSEKYAIENGLELDTTLKLRDLGLSAYHKVNVEKGALGVFFEAIKDGRIKRGSYLLVESLDRLSRASVLDAQRQFQDIIFAGITIVTLGDGMVYSEESIKTNFANLMYSLIIMSRAHEESRTKSQRLKAVWDKKWQDAHKKIVTSMIPSWLEIKDGKFVVIEEKAEVLREVFRLIRNGYGMHLIERKLNSEGVKPFGRGKQWHRSYLMKLVHGRAVLGEYQPMTGRGTELRPNGAPIVGYYPAILSEEDYYAAHNALSVRTTKGGRKGHGIANVFSGLCKCGYCGGTMRYLNKGEGTSWQYLGCARAKSGMGCKHVLWQYYDFETTILSKLAGIDIAGVLRDDSAEMHMIKLASEEAKLDEVRSRIKKLVRIAEVADDVDDLSIRLTELKAQERLLHQSVKELQDLAQLPQLTRKHFQQFKRLREALDSASGEELIDLRLRVSHELKRLLDRIEIYPDGDEPWSHSMDLIGVKPGKEGRFAVAVFKTGEGRVLHGVNSMATIWPGPKTSAGIANAHMLPFVKKPSAKSTAEATNE